MMQKNVEKRPSLGGTYEEFILWSSLPNHERYRLGIKTQGEFAEHYKINKDTLTRWKQRPDFEQKIDKIHRQIASQKTADVIHAIYSSAVNGNSKSQKLWLEYVKGFGSKKKKSELAKPEPPVVNKRSLVFIIDQLPLDLQRKYKRMIDELTDDVKKYCKESPIPEEVLGDEEEWGE